MNTLQTEHSFSLPLGYIDTEGTRHVNGVMRLATASDELLPMKDGRVQSNPAYLTIIVLSRVITQLGTLKVINTKVIEDLFSKDFNYLQMFYNKINQDEGNKIEATCPKCEHRFKAETFLLGEE